MGYVDTTIYGNIATDVEIKQTESGKDRANFLVIANTNKEEKVPLNVTAWGYGAQAAVAAGKGAAVLASGSLKAWSKTDGDPLKYSLNASRVVVPRQPGDGKLQQTKDVGNDTVSDRDEDLPF